MRGEKRSLFRGPVLAIVALAAVLSGSFLLPSCYHYRVTSLADDDVIVYCETAHVLFWGLLETPIDLSENAPDPARQCESNSLYEVRVSTNFGYALITVLTLGIWSPAQVEWRCAAPAERPGEFPDLPRDTGRRDGR